MIDEGFEINGATLGRPDGHVPSPDRWDEGHILCIHCHVQVAECVFFLEPCPIAMRNREHGPQESHA